MREAERAGAQGSISALPVAVAKALVVVGAVAVAGESARTLGVHDGAAQPATSQLYFFTAVAVGTTTARCSCRN